MDKTFIDNIFDIVGKVLRYELISSTGFSLSIGDIAIIVVFFAVSTLLLITFKAVVTRSIKQSTKSEDSSELNRFNSLYQIVKYFVYIAVVLYLFHHFGTDITVILAGSTAIMVGVGLGLQTLFNDIVSGVLILFDRTLIINDIVEVNGVVGKVMVVGLRATTLLTRDDKIIIVPNHYFMAENLVNWTQNKIDTRFKVNVGVAYGSDTDLVRKVLLEAANENRHVMKDPHPDVFFSDFGESSLDFTLLFYTRNIFRINRVKSELRFMIERKFRENGITIPFPQRDIHVIREGNPYRK